MQPSSWICLNDNFLQGCLFASCHIGFSHLARARRYRSGTRRMSEVVLMMIRNYAKQPPGLFARMAAKVAAFTMLQYFNLLNHKPIGQVKYALF